MTTALVYVCDEFSPVDADLASLVDLAERDPERLFDEVVKPFVEECVGGVSGVEVEGVCFSPERGDIVVEYIAKHKNGEVSARLIYSNKPEEALAEYRRRLGQFSP